VFETQRHVLQREEGTIFSAMFSSRWEVQVNLRDDAIFINRSSVEPFEDYIHRVMASQPFVIFPNKTSKEFKLRIDAGLYMTIGVAPKPYVVHVQAQGTRRHPYHMVIL
jgi:hypothetical protein